MHNLLSEVKDRLGRRGSMRPCLTEVQVAAFEYRHAVTLPPDYREFLISVGDGGLGPPTYGLARLGTAAHDMSATEKTRWTQLPDVAKPFPFTNYWCWQDDDQSDQGSREQVDYGSIYLGNDGCGQYWHLIITGPDRGIVWQFTGVGVTHTNPKRTFLQWYSDWLDGADDWFTPA